MADKGDPLYKKNKEYQKFKTQLGIVTASFEKTTSWTDLVNALDKVKKTISDHPTLPVPLKKDLAKRLAQCLNPQFEQIHQLALEIYSIVFAREYELIRSADDDKKMFGADLALFYSGLFNFYQFASFQRKEQFVEMIQKQVLMFKRELVLSLPGFMVCILPGLEEQSETLVKKVEDVLAETEKIVGSSKFFGEIWKTMVRTPRCRLSAIKYLDKRIPKDLESASKLMKEHKGVHMAKNNLVVRDGKTSLEEYVSGDYPEWLRLEGDMFGSMGGADKKQQEAYFFYYYPNKDILVNNAILAGLQPGENNEKFINRSTLDFLISHLPITCAYLSDQEKISIVEGCLQTILKKDFAFLKKFFNWFQGHIEEDSTPQNDDPAIRTVVPALRNIFKRFKKLEEVIKDQILSDQQNQQTGPQVYTPIQIMVNLLSENLYIAEPILQEISVDLIKYIQYYYNDTEVSVESEKKLKFQVENFFQLIEGHLQCVWSALGKLLNQEIEQLSESFYQKKNQVKAVQLITFCLRDLRQSFIGKQNMFNKQMQPLLLTEEAQQEQIHKMQHYVTMLLPILIDLLSGVEKISNQMQNLEFALPALELIDDILEMMNACKIHQVEAVIVNLNQGVEKFNQFYINMCDAYAKPEQSDLKKNNQNQATLNKSSQILYKIQYYADPESFNHMPQWLNKVIECSSEKQRGSKVLLVQIGVFFNIIEKNEQSCGMKKLQELVIPKRRNQFIQSQNFCKEIVKTLWSLLEEPGDHIQIVQLLKKFDIRLPLIFNNVITVDLDSPEREIKLKAVKKFSIFWKLTARDYPNYKPFEPLSLRNKDEIVEDIEMDEKTQIDEIGKKSCCYEALHKMLLILDDIDPTLRLSCRSWLTESKTSFLRILDPLLTEFMDYSKVYRSQASGEIFFLENYEPNVVIQNFAKLRNIILNTQNEFIEYILTTQISKSLEKQCQEQFQQQQIIENENISIRYSNNRYILAIVCLTLQFVTAKTESTESKTLLLETQTVNASACEFMELILNSIHTYKDLSIEVIHIILLPLITSLRKAINERNNAHQVHLLNLFYVIIIEGNFFRNLIQAQKQPKNQQWAAAIFKNSKELLFGKELLGCIVDGIKYNTAFVRYHFITFCQKIVPFMKPYINKEHQAKHISSLIKCFCYLLQKADVSQSSLHFDKQKRVLEDKEKQTKQTAKKKQLQQIKEEEEDEDEDEDEDENVDQDQDEQNEEPSTAEEINEEEDIAQIINGLKNTIHNCLQIKSLTDNDEVDIDQMLKELGKETGKDTEKTYLFGLIGGQKNGKKNSKEKDYVHDAIFSQIQEILLSVVSCWNSIDCFTIRDQLFTRLGVLPYCKEDLLRMQRQIEKQKEDFLNQGFFALEQIKQQENSELVYKVKTDQQVEELNVIQVESGILDQQNESQSISITHKDYLFAHFNVIQTQIFNFLLPLTQLHVKEIVCGFIELWIQKSNFGKIGMNVNEGCQKIIQILLSLDIEPHEVIHSINQYIIEKRFHTTKQKKDTTLDSQSKEVATFQSLICHFVYNYLLHCIKTNFITQATETGPQKNKMYDSEQNNKNYIMLYDNTMKFFKSLIYTRHPITVSWLLEILYILSHKFKPSDDKVEIQVKDEYRDVLDTLLKSATQILQDTFGIKYHDSYGLNQLAFSPTVYEMIKRYEFIKTKHPDIVKKGLTEYEGKNLKAAFELEEQSQEVQNPHLVFTQEQLAKYEEITLQKESVFQDMVIVRKPEVMYKCSYMSEFMKNLNEVLHDKSIRVDDIKQREIFKIFTVITLRQIIIPLTESIHTAIRKDNQYISMQIVLDGVMNVIESQIREIDNQEAQESNSAMVVTEFYTEFLAHLAVQNDLLQKTYKQEITNLFNQEEFFLLDKRILRQWQYIIQNFLSGENNELFQEQLLKFNSVGYFTSTEAQIKHKSLTFKRLAFLVYSSNTGAIEEDELAALLKKMTEGFRNQGKNEDMKQQLFLLSRILMLRLTGEKLEKSLRILWPHLLNELVQVFDVPEKTNDLILTFEAIKIIELMSQLNIEDFQIDQWMFLFDGYGIKEHEIILKNGEKRRENQEKDDDNDLIGDVNGQIGKRINETFQPYMVQFLGKSSAKEDQSKKEFHFYNYKNERLGKEIDDQHQEKALRMTAAQVQSDEKNEIFGIDDNKETSQLEESKIFSYVKIMQISLAQANLQRTAIDRESQEALIEQDFLTKPRVN